MIDADALFRAWMASARQNTMLADFAHHGAQTLGSTSPAGMRLRDVGDFFAHVGQAMLRAAEQWRQTHATRQGQSLDFTGSERRTDA
ncbi:hypothetical protein [Nonomuraea angiospora]